MAFDPQVPYNDLPTLPPPQEIETTKVLKRCLTATRALAELKGAGDVIPDQAILINAIPLQEAKMSSEIENIVTTQDELFHAALDEKSVSKPQTKEVIRYRTALRQGYETLKENPFNLELLETVCGTIHDKTMSFRKNNQQVYIGNSQTGERRYTPPQGGKILKDKLKNLESFLLSDDGIDPLIKMAVAHYQFEAIHPFTDGNGRTGRILNILYLLHARLLEIPVLYLSRYIIENKPDYYRLLMSVTESGDWEAWLLYMLQGIEETAIETKDRIYAIRDLLNETVERCREQIPKVYTKELIELIFRQPYCKIAFVVDAGIAKRQAASNYLQELERIGILKGEKRGRETIYKHPALIEVLVK